MRRMTELVKTITDTHDLLAFENSGFRLCVNDGSAGSCDDELVTGFQDDTA